MMENQESNVTYFLLCRQVESELPDEVFLLRCQWLRLWIANNQLQSIHVNAHRQPPTDDDNMQRVPQ